MTSGRGQQVFAADNFSDLHGVIVGDDRQLVRRKSILAPNDEVAEVAAGDALDAAHSQIGEDDRLLVGHAEPPIHSAGLALIATGGGRRAEMGRKDRLLTSRAAAACNLSVRRDERFLHILTRMRAGIDRAGGVQAAPDLAVRIESAALRVWSVRPADVWAFLPCDSQPEQIFDCRGRKFRAAAIGIEVFVAKDQHAAGSAARSNAVQNVRAWPRCRKPLGVGAIRPR